MREKQSDRSNWSWRSDVAKMETGESRVEPLMYPCMCVFVCDRAVIRCDLQQYSKAGVMEVQRNELVRMQ